jgi:hypothetical protein
MRRACAALLPVLLLSVLPAAADGENDTGWETGSWISIGSGYESESRIDPDFSRAAVPGGLFLNFTPSASFVRAIGNRSRFSLSATASLERHFDDDERLFLALSGIGELTLRSSGLFYGRLTFGGDYWDDSEIDEARRSGVSGSGAMGWGSGRRAMEFIVGARKRTYSDLIVPDDAGIPGTYDETTTSIGAAAYGVVGESGLLRGEISHLSTDSRDPLFDSISWYLRGDARLSKSAKWATWASGLYQRREFDERAAGENIDDYLRLGLRLDRSLGDKRLLTLQYAYARYVETDGQEDDTHRFAIVFTSRFGRAALPTPEPLRAATDLARYDAIIRDGIVLFRIRAEGAAALSVVGDWNGWSAGRDVMRKAGGGWWELTLRIRPGRHQYGYVVDGEWISPPRAKIEVDDGFGGKNGLLVIPD